MILLSLFPGQVTFQEKQSQDLRVFPGQTAHFSCRPHGPLIYDILWLKDDKPLVLNRSRMTLMPSGKEILKKKDSKVKTFVNLVNWNVMLMILYI